MPDPSSFQAIGWIVVSVAALIAIINQAMRLVDRFRSEPPAQALKASSDIISNRVATLETAMSRAEDTLNNAADFDRRIGSLEAGRATDAREASGQRRLLHEKIDRSRDELLGHVESVRRELSQDFKELADKVGGTPSEVVALLRNAGVIK